MRCTVMSGEEVVHILNDEIEDLVEGLAEGIEDAYADIRQIISEDENPEEALEIMKELVRMMQDSGRINREKADKIIGRLEE